MPDDAQLYLRWLDDRDDASFSALARRHANLLYDVARRVGGDHVLAEDALQEALVALACDGTRRPAEVGVRAWLARRAISRAQSARASDRSRAQRERKVASTRASSETANTPPHPREAVRAALSDGGGEGAALLSLRYLHELPYAEIAAIYDVKEATARVRVHRALEDLRGRVRRDDLDQTALAGVLAALPRHTAPSAAVDGAVAAALASAVVAPVAATAAGATVVRTVMLAVAAVVVLTGLGIFALWPRRARAPDVLLAAEPAHPHAPPRLAGREPVAKQGGAPAGRQPVGREPGKTLPPPAAPAAAPSPVPPRPALSPIAVRLDLVHPDGRREPIRIAELWTRGMMWENPTFDDETDWLRVRPGWTIGVRPVDARAAFPMLLAVVPDPVPANLTLRVPTKGDARLEALVVEVVDAETGAAIRHAALEWDEDRHERDTLFADAAGRIHVSAPADAPELPFFYFENTRWYVHARGYRGAGRVWGPGNKEYVASIPSEVVETWLDTGVRRVELQPLHPESGYEERSVTILDDDGHPAQGITVLVVHPLPMKSRFSRYDDGIRRPDRAGRVSFSMQDVVGLEVRIDHAPIAAWCLMRDAWPDAGPRVLRLPPIAEVELVVEGLPDDASGRWQGDPLGAKRTPRDGPAHPPVTDAGVAARLAERQALLPVWGLDAGGPLEGPKATIRVSLAANRAHTLHLRVGNDLRLWRIEPDRADPWQQSVHWDDLPEPDHE